MTSKCPHNTPLTEDCGKCRAAVDRSKRDWIVILHGVAYRRDGGALVSLTPGECAQEIGRSREALKMIAEETLCPDLWREEDRKNWSDDELAHRTAIVIALATLEPPNAQ